MNLHCACRESAYYLLYALQVFRAAGGGERRWQFGLWNLGLLCGVGVF